MVTLGSSEALAAQVPIPAAQTHPLDHFGVLLNEWWWGVLHTCRHNLAFCDHLFEFGPLNILGDFVRASPEFLELDRLS